MIKKEQGLLTYMSQGINNIPRDNVVAGINFAQGMDEKLEKALLKDRENDDMER